MLDSDDGKYVEMSFLLLNNGQAQQANMWEFSAQLCVDEWLCCGLP